MIKLKQIVCLCICLVPFLGNAQTSSTNKKDSTLVFEAVQVAAEFPGGVNAWGKYLRDSLNSDLGAEYIVIPKGKKEAKATIIITFIVDKEGNVTNVQSETSKKNIHPKLIAEAIRVVKQSPKWKPAIHQGKEVIYRHRQSITFATSIE